MSLGHRAVQTKTFYDKQHGIWSSPNMTVLSHSIPPLDMEIPAESRYKDFRTPRWLSNKFPYMAFWPNFISFTGSIFSRLNISSSNIKVVSAGPAKYTLSPETVASWQRLENALIGLCMFLLRRKMGNIAELGYLPLPRECGYMSLHAEPRFVRGCAYKSRDAFVTLATICSFAIAVNISPLDEYSPQPEWVSACQAEGVHPQWLKDLQQSFVCNFAPGVRSGAFMYGYKTCWARAIPAFVNANVPLWIFWGHASLTPTDERMLAYRPSKDEAMKAKQFALDSSLHPQGSVGDETQFPVDFPHDNGFDMAPDPEPGSRQLKGETLQQFCARMESDRTNWLENIDNESHNFALTTEEAAKKLAADGTFQDSGMGTAIYVWVDRPGGHRLRKQIPLEEWEACWSRCSPSLRRYYIHIDEWDLQMDVTNGDLSSSDVSDTQSSTIVESNDVERVVARHNEFQTVIRARPPPNLSEHPNQSFADDIAQLYDSSVLANTVDTAPLEKILQNRYGFVVQGGEYHRHPRMTLHGKVAANTNNQPAAMSRLGLKFHHPHRLQEAVFDLYNYVVYHGLRPIVFPPLWDFNPRLVEDIRAHPKFHHIRCSEGLHLIGVKDKEKALVDQWYLLAVPSACTVLQIFRENESSLLGAVRSLIRRGIQFATVQCFRHISGNKMLQERNSIGLGTFNKLPTFDTTAYAAYERAKRDVLCSSRGRVALMRGGIVWRLAQNIVNVRAVTRGPSIIQAFSYGKFHGCELVDDGLAQEDEDIICGVYHHKTGKSSYCACGTRTSTYTTNSGARHRGFVVAKNEYME
jgi:hypothetical protein